MLKAKMKDVPAGEQEAMMRLVEENPELFQKIALEVQTKLKEGKDEMTAAMEVMQAHQDELKNVMGK